MFHKWHTQILWTAHYNIVKKNTWKIKLIIIFYLGKPTARIEPDAVNITVGSQQQQQRLDCKVTSTKAYNVRILRWYYHSRNFLLQLTQNMS